MVRIYGEAAVIYLLIIGGVLVCFALIAILSSPRPGE